MKQTKAMAMGETSGFVGWRRAILGVWAASWAVWVAPPVWAESAVLEASADATLIESASGEVANGSGPALFAGRNNASVGSVRRALLAFDVADALPRGAWITGVRLELELNPSNPDVIDLGLHRVLSAWSEGPSSASGGGGAAAQPGDATWLHTHYDAEFWEEPGGDFASLASAVATVVEPGVYVWGSTPGLVADVWGWLDDPASNHGWILVGGEFERQTAKSFASRESPMEASRPHLVVEYETRCDAFELRRGGLGPCRAYCEALECAGPEPLGSATACRQLARRFASRAGDAPLPCVRPGFEGN